MPLIKWEFGCYCTPAKFITNKSDRTHLKKTSEWCMGVGGGGSIQGSEKSKNRLNKNEQKINLLPYQDIWL
jgi:hypothetical protein